MYGRTAFFCTLCCFPWCYTVVVALLSVFISFGPFSQCPLPMWTGVFFMRPLLLLLFSCLAVSLLLSNWFMQIFLFSLPPHNSFFCPIVVVHTNTYTYTFRLRIRLFISKCSFEPRFCACASLSSLLWRAEHANGIDERDLLWPIFMKQTHFNEIQSIGIHYGPQKYTILHRASAQINTAVNP